MKERLTFGLIERNAEAAEDGDPAALQRLNDAARADGYRDWDDYKRKARAELEHAKRNMMRKLPPLLREILKHYESDPILRTWLKHVETHEAIERVASGLPPAPKPRPGSSVDDWLGWYHALREWGLKITLKDIAEMSGYSLGWLKNRHEGCSEKICRRRKRVKGGD